MYSLGSRESQKQGEMAMEMNKGKVCVTGAGGFIGSWLVKLLLSNGYTVHGTVRNPKDQRHAHLNKLEKASENLKLIKADLSDYDSLRSAIEGCKGVFHLACPMQYGSSNPEVEILDPAIKGTLNVLRACSEAKVKRVVYVSSIAAILFNPSWPGDKAMDEACWNDKEFCKKIGAWYCLAKAEAESMALDYGKKYGIDVVSVCPATVVGPVLIPFLEGLNAIIIDLVQGKRTILGDLEKTPSFVDVRDVAAAMLLVYEKPDAEGRYICKAYSVKTRALKELLKGLHPEFTYYENFQDQADCTLSSSKLQRLSWTYRPLVETLKDSIRSYRATGLLKC